MRGAGFGFVGLLLCAGIIFYLMWGGPGTDGGTVRRNLEAKKHAEETVKELTGRDDRGESVTAAVTWEEAPKGLLVKSIAPGSTIEQKYGLRAGDIIVEAGALEIKGQPDPQGSVQFAYSRNEKLIVLRNNQKITLPDQRNVGDAPVPAAPEEATAPTSANETPAPAPAHEPRTNPKSQARDLLKKIETH